MIMKKFRAWFNGMEVAGKATFIAILGVLSIGFVGAAAQSSNTNTTPSITTVKSVPKVDVKTETTTESIPFSSSTIESGTLERGVTQIQTKGANGVLTHTYQVTYTDGIETNRSLAVDTITTPAINEVILHGTKTPDPVCDNGTYVNTYGNTVCRPYSSSSAPAGASAQCSDGTYSFSQTRRGTCSHHGGVATWL